MCYSNHPVIKEDGLLSVFLTEPSFETWRKHSTITYEEESASKRVDKVEEMSIPSDLEEKLAYVSRGYLLLGSLTPLLILAALSAPRSALLLSNGRKSAYSPSA